MWQGAAVQWHKYAWTEQPFYPDLGWTPLKEKSSQLRGTFGSWTMVGDLNLLCGTWYLPWALLLMSLKVSELDWTELSFSSDSCYGHSLKVWSGHEDPCSEWIQVRLLHFTYPGPSSSNKQQPGYLPNATYKLCWLICTRCPFIFRHNSKCWFLSLKL